MLGGIATPKVENMSVAAMVTMINTPEFTMLYKAANMNMYL